jgi:NAD(P)-dependent dehydrogenase (short-subunit alcohol dehydrogenase family)
MSSEGKVAIITGGGTGIGKASALTLAADGYSVTISGRRAEPLQETIEEAGEAGSRMLGVQADVGDPESVKNLFAKSQERFGRLDVVFSNAGSGAPPVLFEDLTYDQWMAVVNANLTGTFLCAQEAIKIMKNQDPMGGRIINNGSISAMVPRPNSAPYTATKHGVSGLTKAISLDGRKYDIVCSQIDVGNAATSMTVRMGNGVLQANGETMIEPTMDVQNVADAVLYMSNLPLNANVQFMTVMAAKMPYVGRG